MNKNKKKNNVTLDLTSTYLKGFESYMISVHTNRMV